MRQTLRQLATRWSTFSLISTLLVVGVVLTACDDFYSDSPPTPEIAQPTPEVSETDPQESVEELARAALSARLGIAPGDARKILLEEDTWTSRSPGCYPPPNTILDDYLVPGFRLILSYEGVRYEYNDDLGGVNGALCETTPQPVPAELANEIVTAQDVDEDDVDVWVIRSEEELILFNTENSSIAEIELDQVDWEVEFLIGSVVDSDLSEISVSAFRSLSGGESETVTIEIHDSAPSETATSQIWTYVDITELTDEYQFELIK